MTDPVGGSDRPVVLYERGRSPAPLLPSELEELRSAVGPFAREVLDDRTGLGWREVLIPLAKGGLVVVYRIEHLGKVEHRATRLRRLVEVDAELHVHSGLPLPYDSKDAMLALASYTEGLLDAERAEQRSEHALRIRAGQARKGRRGGRPRKVPVSSATTAPEGAGSP